jgi:hypothetical protein
MQTPIGSGSWQGEARRVRAQGKTSAEIAALLDKAPSIIREALGGTPRPPIAGHIRSRSTRAWSTLVDRRLTTPFRLSSVWP